MEGSMDSICGNTSAPSAPQDKQETGAASRNVKAKQAAASGGGEHKPRPPQEKGVKCPRCPSTNTKFCYYNNNSVAQPRYFCKGCRRYWTLGGSQRKVPVGGACRKNKQQTKPASPSSSGDSNKKISISQQLMMMSTATAPLPADFPNVLPTFMSMSGGVLPAGGNLPFAPLPLPSNAGGAMPSFIDMLRGGGFVDGGSNGMMALPFVPAPSMMMTMGHQQLHLQGVDQEVKPKMGAAAGGGGGLQQWLPSSQHDGGIFAAGGSPAGGGAVKEQEQQAVACWWW